MTTVFIPEQLAKVMGGNKELAVQVESIKGLIDYISTTFPDAIGRIFRDGKINRNINVYVNGEDIRFLKSLDTPLKNDDEVSLVPMIAGG